MSQTEHAPGSRIGDYEIERLLGAGGMGAVHLARHLETGARIALKLMHPETAKEDVLRRRFLREARATMALDHPNIIRIVASFEHEGQPVIGMEVLNGLSLKDYLQQEGRLGVEEVAGIFQRVVSALGAAHALGLVHRDLKPDNVFLLETEPYVKVLDFGIAKLRKGGALSESSALTKTGMMIGTPYYMSPEQAFGEKDIDHRADIWSLGMMLYEVLSGTLPTRADDLEEIFRRLIQMDFPRLDALDPTIPADVAQMVAAMLQRNVEERLSDLHDVQAVLGPYAPDIQSIEFAPASRTLSFDEPSVPSAPSVRAPQRDGSRSEPLKLAPGVLRPSGIQRAAGGTVIVDPGSASSARNAGSPPLPAAQPPPAPTPPVELASTLEAAALPPPPRPAVESPGSLSSATPRASVTSVPPPGRSQAWMWIIAALIVIGSVVVLLTQLR